MSAALPEDLVDLVSDTATRPTSGMYEAMRRAPLGDEQKGEDPSVNELERRAAELLGHERAMLMPSATMANQIALALWCRPGDEVLCHRSAHVFNYETGGTAINGRAQTNPLDGDRGLFSGDDVKARIRPEDPHLPETRVVVVENTSNGGGGTVWPDPLFQGVADVCDAHGLKLHIDGARLMNASVKRGAPPTHWTKRAASVQMCFSKGLGCPFGAILAFPDEHWRFVRRRKQAMGGAFRQAGVLAGAMLYALDHHVDRLAEDHARTARLAEGLSALDGLSVEPAETNLVFFRVVREGLSTAELCRRLLEQGVRMGSTPDGRVRACVHLGIDDHGIDRALAAAKAALGRA